MVVNETSPGLASKHQEAVYVHEDATARRLQKQAAREEARKHREQENNFIVVAATFEMMRDYAAFKPLDRLENLRFGREKLRIQFYRMFQWWRTQLVSMSAENVAYWVAIRHADFAPMHRAWHQWRYPRNGYDNELYLWAVNKIMFGASQHKCCRL